jgi:hypothetical protein
MTFNFVSLTFVITFSQLSRCPVVLARLEVLDLSENRLTDAAGRHLANLVENGSGMIAHSA